MAEADIDTTTTRRGFLGHAAGAYLAAGALTVGTVAVDPIFGLLAEHRDLWNHVAKLADETDRAFLACGSGSKELEICEAAQSAASWREIEYLRHAVAPTVPTTLAGLIAYVDHMCSDYGFGASELAQSQNTVLETIGASLRAIQLPSL